MEFFSDCNAQLWFICFYFSSDYFIEIFKLDNLSPDDGRQLIAPQRKTTTLPLLSWWSHGHLIRLGALICTIWESVRGLIGQWGISPFGFISEEFSMWPTAEGGPFNINAAPEGLNLILRESWQVCADGWYWTYVHLHVLMPVTQLGPVNMILSTAAKHILNIKQHYNSMWKITLDSLTI